jgi:hypothetical protein
MTDEEQQAFPDGILNQDGMTLRDYFAAKAMQALIDKEAFFDDVAESAYKVADHMLRVREQ